MKKDIRIFIGGSIYQDISDSYRKIAKELGNKINQRDYKIVFDGCLGLPSIVFEEIDRDDSAIILHTKYYGTKYVDNYYANGSSKIFTAVQLENQSQMTDAVIGNSDAFIFMKGQMGTLEEISRIINGRKNNEHDKPIVILNINHEWDDLANILQFCGVGEFYHITDDITDAFNYIESELFKETSNYYKMYVSRGYADRQHSIIEKNDDKKKHNI